MSCSTGANQVSAAARAACGISALTSKAANFAARNAGTIALTGGGLALAAGAVLAGKKGARLWLERVREAQRREAEAQARRRQRIVQQVKDPERRQAALELQANLAGRTVRRGDLAHLVDGPGLNRLSGDTWLAEGELGQVVVEDRGDGQCRIKAIRPELGQELALRNTLAAYSSSEQGELETRQSPPARPASRAGQAAARAKTWLGNNREEVKFAAANAAAYGLPLAFSLAAGRHPARPVDLQSTSARLVSATLTIGGLYAQFQKLKAAKLGARRLVEALDSPDYRPAAVALQREFHDRPVPRESLAALMRGMPRRVAGDTWQVSGPLGRVYYDEAGDGQATIQAIRPALSREAQLYQGLKALAPAG